MKVLVIENDQGIVEAISLAFQIRWPEAKLISTHLGEAGIALVETEKPDAVILDLGLDDISGFDVLKQIRLFSSVPVLILTVRTDEIDVVKGLEWGADDYVVKPFRQFELLSRIKALTRRQGQITTETPLVCGNIRLDPATGQLFLNEKEVNLTPTEVAIISHLIKNVGRVVTHASLTESVWSDNHPDAANSLKVYIRRLRKKLETDPGHPRIILTKTGVGYQMARPD
jgi:two-component system KDP operon response regulator KdpE